MAILDGSGGDGESGGLVHKLDSLDKLVDLFQIPAFVAAAQKAGKPHLAKGGKAPGGKPGNFTLDDLLVYSNEPIPTSLLKLSADNVTRSVQMFGSILSYTGDDKLTEAQRIETVQKLMHQGLKRPELRDELYMQLVKQTRGNTVPESRQRAWELFNLVAASMPPSKDFIGMVSTFVSQRALDDGEFPQIMKLSANTWNCLKRTTRAGPRRMMPSAEEISACLKDTKLSTIVFFMDDTFDNLDYDLTTTVQEATGVLAAHINLQHYKTFTIYECRRIHPQKGQDAPDDQFFLLDENRYIADILVDLKSKNDKNGKDATNKLVFKKRLYRAEDAHIDDYQFTNLSFIQSQSDFVQGHYPVVKEDAAEMCAIQIAAEHAGGMVGDDIGIMNCIEKYITKQVLMTRPKDDWLQDVGSRYKPVSDLSKEEARTKFLQTLRGLPYGLSTFFAVKKVEDPVGLLPPKVILAVNFRGVHFFRPSPKEYLHSVELKDVVQFGSSATSVFLRLKVQDVPHVFQFETKYGGEVCFLLKSHIYDMMAKRFQKLSPGGEVESEERTAKKEEGRMEQHLTQLQKALEDSQNLVDSLARSNDEMHYAKEKLLAEIEDINAGLKREQESRDQLQEQAKELEKIVQGYRQEIDVYKAKAKAAESAAASAGAELAAIDTAHFAKLEELLVERTEQANKMAEKKAEIDKRTIQLAKEKEVLDNKLKKVEKTLEAENKELRGKLDGVTGDVKSQLAEKDTELNQLAEELAKAQNELNDAQAEIGIFKSDGKQMEMQEILEMQAEVERKAKQNEHILEDQAKHIAEVEKTYRDEVTRRKGLFNQLEDIRGKLRVYCRVRPPASGENSCVTTEDQNVNVNGKEFMFDSVFGATDDQEAVFNDCKHCVGSAMEGMNVVLLTMGQSGSGRTYTTLGTKDAPGLAPRFADDFFRVIEKGKGKLSYKMSFSMTAINSDTVVDLLLPAAKRGKPPRLDIRKDWQRGHVYVAGAVTVEIRDAAHLKKVLEYGDKSAAANAKDGIVSMNFMLESTHANSGAVNKGKLTLIDLPLEKGKSSKNSTALQNVVTALVEEQEHVPYKDSKLTMLLADALGGGAKTVLLVTASPADLDETFFIFDLAGRMSKIKNFVRKSENDKDLQKLLKQVDYWMNQAGVPEKQRVMEWASLEDIECVREQDETRE